MAASILERIIDNRVALLRTLLTAEYGDRPCYDGALLSFEEPAPFTWWALDVEAPDPNGSRAVSKYKRDVHLWFGLVVEYAGGEPWRRLLRYRADIQAELGANFSLAVPIDGAGTEANVTVMVKELGSSTPILPRLDTSGSLGCPQVKYQLSYQTSRAHPGIH